MSLRTLLPREGLLGRQGARIHVPTTTRPGRGGHAHFWERTASRRRFLQTAAGASGLLLGAGLAVPIAARAARPPSSEPSPIPGGIQPFGPGTEVFHLFLPEPGNEPSTITDFNGFLGVARITGYGTATDGAGQTRRLFYDADMRFMKGLYVGKDGRHRQGTFGFF